MAGFLKHSDLDDVLAEGEKDTEKSVEKYFELISRKVVEPIHGGEMEMTAFGMLVSTGSAAINRFYESSFRFRDAKLFERCPNGILYIRDERFG